MKTLVLDRQYQPLRFISYRKLAHFIIKDKVEVISIWDDEYFLKGQKYPSIVRLKDYIRKKPRIPRFNRRALFRRDNFICQYTGKKYPPGKLTVDHVIPRAKGGKTTWDNCVTACLAVNSFKGDKSMEECGLELLNQPKPPAQPLTLEYSALNRRHSDWSMYFVDVE